MKAFLRKAAAALLGAALAGCATYVPPPSAGSASAGAPLEGWAVTLRRHVDDQGRTDFAGVKSDLGPLSAYLAFVARTSPDSNPGQFPTAEARLAYYVDSYNALAMYNVVDFGLPERLSLADRVRFFKLRRFKVGGRDISLYDYENDVIRPLGDERIHFALNCMAVSCPRLPRVPFSTGDLNRRLDEEAAFFFSEPRNLEVDHQARVVRVSEILKFYTEDFLRREPTLIAYINRYRTDKIPAGYKVEFINYDWTISHQPRGRRIAAAG